MADININEVYEELKYIDAPETSRLIKAYLAMRDADAKLRAALKPVLECPDRWHGHWPFAAYASDAVKEAQRIYKEEK